LAIGKITEEDLLYIRQRYSVWHRCIDLPFNLFHFFNTSTKPRKKYSIFFISS